VFAARNVETPQLVEVISMAQVQTTSGDVDPLTQAFVVDRQAFWSRFTQFTKYAVIVVVVLLVLMWWFIV
jgi:hypothetical protein